MAADAYLVPDRAWFVTIGTHDRAAVFARHDGSLQVIALLKARCLAMGAGLDAYCLMPDHAHLLLQVTRVGLVDVVRDVKSRSTQLWWRLGGVGPLWPRSFHERGIRHPNDHERAAAYILTNPSRAGLVDDWPDYPYLGGALVDAPSPDAPRSEPRPAPHPS